MMDLSFIDTLKIGIKISEVFFKDNHKETYILVDGSDILFERFPFLNERVEDISNDLISKLFY